MSLAGEDLLARLPHRPPFLFVTRVTRLEPTAGQAVWAVDGHEGFFVGHFPRQPVVPGVLIVEALAQVAGVVAGASGGEGGAGPALQGRLAQVDVRFFDAATPPAQITLSVHLQRGLGKLWLFDVAATLGEKRLAAGTLTLALDGGVAADE